MKGIPPEIDALMWQLAENGNPIAQAEFEARHTRYGPELTRRIRMVGELRQAGKTVVHRPTFTPRPARVAPVPKWAVGATVGLAVIAAGAVVFVATTPSEKKAVPPPVIHVQGPPREAPIPKENPDSMVSKGNELPKPNAPEEKLPSETATDYLKPRDIHLEDAQLTAAITLVAQKSGLEVTLAPGFQDRRVSLDYRGQNAVEILREMGETYGFTIFQESEGHLLAVPARSEADSTRRVGP